MTIAVGDRLPEATLIEKTEAGVAPVTVGKDGTIGAGSVVNKNTEPGALTVARAKQVSLSNWQRPKKQPK